MRDIRNGVCPLCEHNEILKAVPAEFAHGGGEVPSAVTYDPRWIMSGRNAAHPHGLLSTWVCRACGYVQWFARKPENIPIGEEHRTALITGPGKAGPFR